MLPYEKVFLLSLLITELLELPTVLLSYTLFIKKNINANVIITILFCSLLTIPYLWFVFPSIINTNYFILVGEVIVILVETVIYFFYLKINFLKAMIISLIANTFSYYIGIELIKYILVKS
jgi:hypothetical protein